MASQHAKHPFLQRKPAAMFMGSGSSQMGSSQVTSTQLALIQRPATSHSQLMQSLPSQTSSQMLACFSSQRTDMPKPRVPSLAESSSNYSLAGGSSQRCLLSSSDSKPSSGQYWNRDKHKDIIERVEQFLSHLAVTINSFKEQGATLPDEVAKRLREEICSEHKYFDLVINENKKLREENESLLQEVIALKKDAEQCSYLRNILMNVTCYMKDNWTRGETNIKNEEDWYM